MVNRLFMAVVLAVSLMVAPGAANAQQGGSLSDTYSSDEILNAGHQFFGSVAQGLASLIERSFAEYGQPNGYILGQEGSGALFAGARFGEGVLHTRNAGSHNVFWQGPSLGLNFGGDGSRVMMLVYNLPSVDTLYDRYPGVDGSIYAVGGLGMTALRRNDIYIVPISSGVGIRAGVSVGYLKFTQEPTWNPF
ncbi:DUF1134 domain-containing protein [Pelagibacterium lentulum]|uniref:DUF1134 domain-containing protein n=1 Tax=Pelagibacterium lentulum TaxID=2029865 RepID=A0A916W0C4_9HYPH|nr:DUF1134 domain-containing protein [Pelagibacterium lentulum]GGA57613.1 hypothetical protein GCM10011499_29770 [Pelagibacterium lentulum]